MHFPIRVQRRILASGGSKPVSLSGIKVPYSDRPTLPTINLTGFAGLSGFSSFVHVTKYHGCFNAILNRASWEIDTANFLA